MELPKREQNRLKCFDYRNPGYYFITICTRDKEKLFWEHSNSEKPKLSCIGIIVEQSICRIPEVYSIIHLDKYVIMPNHVHFILNLEGYYENPDGPSISTIVGQTKRVASKAAKRELWQRSFHDHIIRGENDYQKIWQYIDDNPRKWEEDCVYIE